MRTARWIVVDPSDSSCTDETGFTRYIRKYESGTRWQTVYSSHGVVVLHERTAASPARRPRA